MVSLTQQVLGSIMLSFFCAFYLSYYLPWWVTLMLWNALNGLTLFNMFWFQVQRYKDVNEERDSLFPAFRRLDAKNWDYWKFIPGALTIYPLRGLMGCWLLFILAVISKIILIGHKLGKEPLTGWRRVANEAAYRGLCWCIVTNCGVSQMKHHPVVDYSEYLGKDYRQTQKLPPKASTLVANHSSWLDQIVLITQCYPGFAAAIETSKVLVLETLITNLQSIYISRGGTEEQRAKNIEEIDDRQKLVEADPRFP